MAVLSQVYKFIEDAGKMSLEQFHEFKSEPIDIADFVKHSIEVCSINDLYEALLNLLRLIPFADYKSIKDCTVNLNREYPLQTLFSSMYLNSDGKLIGFVPPSDLKTTDEQILYSYMIKYYFLSFPIYVRGAIIPGIKTIIQNSKISLIEINHIVEKSGLIQRSQIPIISKGIAAGFDFDFATAWSLLVPQIESIVRTQLKKYGVKTTYTDFKKGGVETENSIDSLIRLPETKEIFGEDIVFEMDVLFCQPLGGNLRNKIAHGLMSYDEFFSDYSIFAFGFILKLIFNSVIEISLFKLKLSLPVLQCIYNVKIKEMTRDNLYPLYQDDNGTNIFTSFVYSALKNFKELLSLNMEYFIIDTIFLDQEYSLNALKIFNDLRNNKEVDLDRFYKESKYELGSGFLHTNVGLVK